MKQPLIPLLCLLLVAGCASRENLRKVSVAITNSSFDNIRIEVVCQGKPLTDGRIPLYLYSEEIRWVTINNPGNAGSLEFRLLVKDDVGYLGPFRKCVHIDPESQSGSLDFSKEDFLDLIRNQSSGSSCEDERILTPRPFQYPLR